jgi:hypothetical protein
MVGLVKVSTASGDIYHGESAGPLQAGHQHCSRLVDGHICDARSSHSHSVDRQTVTAQRDHQGAATTSGLPSIADLLGGMHALRQSGGRDDLRLTPTACHNCPAVINTYRALKDYRDQAVDLADPSKHGNPGDFPSAIQTAPRKS